MTPAEIIMLILAVWPVAALTAVVFMHGGSRKRYPSPPATRQIGVDLAA